MATVAQKMKMFDARTGRGASPLLRRRRRAFNATAAFRAFTKGDLERARAHIAFALNNGARLADLGRAGRQVAQNEEQREAWLALLRQSPMYSLRARLIQISRVMGEKYGTAPFSEEAISELVGDAEPAVLAQEAALEQSLVSGAPANVTSYASDYGATTYSPILYPGVKAKHKRPDAELREVAARSAEKTSKFIFDGGSTPVYLRDPYLTGSDWREIAASSTKCLFPAKVDEKKRPLPPEDAQWGTAEFDVWVNGLCYEDGKEKALAAEAEGLALREQQFAGVNAFVAKMVESMKETERQQALNLDAAFRGLPLPYTAPPKNAPGVTSLYVLPPNYAVPGLPVNPASWKGSHATKGPPAPPGAIAGQIYTPPPVASAAPPQQVVDPVTGQVTVIPAPAGTTSTAYPGGPAAPTYPAQPGQTYPGYTPPPPPPPEESLTPPKKKKKKSSMTLPLVLGVGALGVGALVVIRSRR